MERSVVKRAGRKVHITVQGADLPTNLESAYLRAARTERRLAGCSQKRMNQAT